MKGFLQKRSDGKPDQGLSTGNVLAHWSRRWFVLTQDDGRLSYFKDPQDPSPAGFVEVAQCEIKRLPPEPQSLLERLVAARPSDYIFVIVTGARILTLSAKDETELGQWIGAIALVQQQHQAQLNKLVARSNAEARMLHENGQQLLSAREGERRADVELTAEAEQRHDPDAPRKKVDERLDRAKVANRERHERHEKPRAVGQS